MCEKERFYAHELYELSKEIKHPSLRTLIRGIALDSEKHSVFYEAVINLLKHYPLMIKRI